MAPALMAGAHSYPPSRFMAHKQPKPTRKRAASSSPGNPDQAMASYLAAKALARSGELPGCDCYAELSEPEFHAEGACHHVLAFVAKQSPAKSPPRSPSLHSINHEISLLGGELRSLRQQLESEEDIDDDQLDAIEQALEQLEPKRKPASQPSEAITKEAQIAVYGERYDNDEELWCERDAWVRQGRRTELERAGNFDLHMGRVEIAEVGPDGRVRVVERVVVQGAGGETQIVGAEESASASPRQERVRW